MTQYGRPASDITTEWTPSTGATHFGVLDEVAADDNDYISTTANAKTFEVKLSSVTDPQANTGHVIRIRAYASGSSGAERLNTWGLYQGASAIVTQNDAITRNSFNPYTITLSAAQADTITNYADLRVRGLSAMAAGETLRVSWVQLDVPDAPAVPDALTGANLDAAAWTVGAPTISQTHILSAPAISDGSPSVDSAVLSQIHILTGVSVDMGTPVLEAPTASAGVQTDELTATGIDGSAPTVGTPTVSQNHVLSASAIASASPDVGVGTLAQIHALFGAGVTLATPEVGSGSIAQIHALSAGELTSGVPSLTDPVLQLPEAGVDALVGSGIDAQAFALGIPVLSQTHNLSTLELLTGTPSLAEVLFSQVHILGGVELVTSYPSLGAPNVTIPGAKTPHSPKVHLICQSSPRPHIDSEGEIVIVSAMGLVISKKTENVQSS